MSSILKNYILEHIVNKNNSIALKLLQNMNFAIVSLIWLVLILRYEQMVSY